jgi:hypothetical protein
VPSKKDPDARILIVVEITSAPTGRTVAVAFLFDVRVMKCEERLAIDEE